MPILCRHQVIKIVTSKTCNAEVKNITGANVKEKNKFQHSENRDHYENGAQTGVLSLPTKRNSSHLLNLENIQFSTFCVLQCHLLYMFRQTIFCHITDFKT